MKQGLLPGVSYPRVPGHEVAGVIDEVGKDVVEWKTGQRVGVGWHGGQCGHCESCRHGEFFACRFAQITGSTYECGYSDYMITSSSLGA
jgi:D-arabinose 1-dehydrogenase-like Zn-dependent alcohol dehydrogenase